MRGFRVELPIGLVAHDQAIAAVVNDEAFRNAVDSVVQGLLHCTQLLLDFPAQSNVGFQTMIGLLQLASLGSQLDLLLGAMTDLTHEIDGEASQQYRRHSGYSGDHHCVLARRRRRIVNHRPHS